MSPSRFTPKALAVALVSLGLAFGASAQTAAPSGTGSSAKATTGSATSAATSSKSTLTRGDRKFMENAAAGGLAEVQLGQLAASKAGSDQVKQFGQRMVDDHTKANDQLKQVASSKGVTLPTDLDSKMKREHDKLSKLSGADFDREYMKLMVSDHKKDVKEFQSAANNAKDADVKSFAAKTLPTLQEHLSLAQSTDDAVKSASRGGATKSGASSGARTPSSSSSGSMGSPSSATGGTGKASGAGSATAQSGTAGK